ncbi:S8/S53 family peptidase [Myxococcota bacterium]|nr:S8/S53 family peptidase [Myxococcota bacterium]MBU1900510.1 S8/S53 family peptidase [Myxococcota bacterium]
MDSDLSTLYKVVFKQINDTVQIEVIDDQGNFLSEKDLSKIIAHNYGRLKEESGSLDPFSKQWIVESGYINNNSSIVLKIHPEIDLGLVSSREDSLYYSQELEHVRESAIIDLVNSLPYNVSIIDINTRSATIRIPIHMLYEITHNSLIASSSVIDSRFNLQMQFAASANVSIGLDTFRYADPIHWTGNGSGSSIKLGFFDIYAGPFPPTFHGNLVKNSPSKFCYDASSCGPFGACGGSGCSCINYACYDNHATAVYSILSSRDNSSVLPYPYVGMFNAKVYFDDQQHHDFSTTVNWWANNSVHIALTPPINPYLLDDTVRNDNILIINPAGNSPNLEVMCLSSNAVCVGSYDHHTMSIDSYHSSWMNLDGILSGRELPDLVAPGVNLNVFDAINQDWRDWGMSGTSFAAAIVATVVVGLHDLSKTFDGPNFFPILEYYPELTKSLIMTSSIDDIVDDNDGGISGYSELVDNKDGAGGIRADILYEIWTNSQWKLKFINNSSPTYTTIDSIYLNRGETIRVYMAWNRCPSNVLEYMNADFDLYLYNSGNKLVRYGNSSYQTYEGLSYTAPDDGFYPLVIKKLYVNDCGSINSETIGVSWYIQ